MAIVKLQSFKKILKPGQCILGLDHGLKTIGLSISDQLLIIASPLRTITRTKFSTDIFVLKKIIKKFDIGAVVIGLPINMNGTEGPRCQSVRQFVSNLLSVIEVPVSFWDERLSTAAINRVLISEADMSRKKRNKIIDKMAAAYILQGALDSLSQNK